MDVYVIIGTPHSRKSAVVRSLTGCFNRSKRNILLTNGSQIDVYARVSSLQESKTTAQQFFQEANNSGCNNVIFCLWPHANSSNPTLFPDAQTYLSDFINMGWNISKVALLSSSSNATIYPNQATFLNPTTVPINQLANSVKLHFGWQ